MKKENCNIGQEVIVNCPGQYVDNCTGNIVEMRKDKVCVAIQCLNGRVFDFGYNNIEPYEVNW